MSLNHELPSSCSSAASAASELSSSSSRGNRVFVPRWANFRKELSHCALALALIDPKLEYGTKPFLHERIGQKVEKLRQSRFLSHSGMALVK